MTLKPMVMEFGVGTDIRGENYTKAAVRALENALRHNSISIADALGKRREDMQVKILIGVAKPDEVDAAAVAAVLPYGQAEVRVVEGGLDTPLESGEGAVVMANAGLTVYLDVDEDRNVGGTS